MEQRIFHGQITPSDVAQNLIGHFNRANLMARQYGSDKQVVVQITTPSRPASGGQTALSVFLQSVEDGVSVQVGQQAWMGVAASLGTSALAALRNPLALLGRLDDIAQDIESLQLSEEVWKVIEGYMQSVGAGYQLSERLRRVVCEYCGTANPVGEPHCIACGAPLGISQPRTCASCGFVITSDEKTCPNCRRPL